MAGPADGITGAGVLSVLTGARFCIIDCHGKSAARWSVPCSGAAGGTCGLALSIWPFKAKARLRCSASAGVSAARAVVEQSSISKQIHLAVMMSLQS